VNTWGEKKENVYKGKKEEEGNTENRMEDGIDIPHPYTLLLIIGFLKFG